MLAYITMPDKESALNMAASLVDAHMAAGVNILGPILSVYRWQGEIRQKEEWLLLAQTHDFPGLENFALKSHPYEVPCVIGLPVAVGHKPFMDWIANAGERACVAPS